MFCHVDDKQFGWSLNVISTHESKNLTNRKLLSSASELIQLLNHHDSALTAKYADK